jgi:hypothetical protein
LATLSADKQPTVIPTGATRLFLPGSLWRTSRVGEVEESLFDLSRKPHQRFE